MAFWRAGVPSSADRTRSSARSCSSDTFAKSHARSSTVAARMAAVASSERGVCVSLLLRLLLLLLPPPPLGAESRIPTSARVHGAAQRRSDGSGNVSIAPSMRRASTRTLVSLQTTPPRAAAALLLASPPPISCRRMGTKGSSMRRCSGSDCETRLFLLAASISDSANAPIGASATDAVPAFAARFADSAYFPYPVMRGSGSTVKASESREETPVPLRRMAADRVTYGAGASEVEVEGTETSNGARGACVTDHEARGCRPLTPPTDPFFGLDSRQAVDAAADTEPPTLLLLLLLFSISLTTSATAAAAAAPAVVCCNSSRLWLRALASAAAATAASSAALEAMSAGVGSANMSTCR